MKADTTAKKQEKIVNSTADSFLSVRRKPVKEWSCRFVENSYEIIQQVGEGTFR